MQYWPAERGSDTYQQPGGSKKRQCTEQLNADLIEAASNFAEPADDAFAFHDYENQIINPALPNEVANSDVSSNASSSSSSDDAVSVASSAPTNYSDSASSQASDHEDAASDDSDESDSHANVSPPLYPGCALTQDEGVLQIMNLFVKHRMEKSEIGSILQTVLNLIPKGNALPKTQFTLFQHVEKLSPVSPAIVHFYCCDCHHYVGLVEIPCDLCGGQCKKFYQLSIEAQLKNLFENHDISDAIEKYALERAAIDGSITDLLDGSSFKAARISGMFNCTLLGHSDGISMSDSSIVSMWPLEFVVVELPPHLRYKYVIIAGIWIDDCKPTMNEYLKPFVEELETLGTVGFTWTHPRTEVCHTSQVTVPCFCVDAPVRSSLQNSQAFNGRYGCNICEQKTKKLPPEPVLPGVQKVKRKRVFTFQENDAKLRTMDRMDTQGRESAAIRKGRPGMPYKPVKGVKGDSLISSIPGCDRSCAVYPEYMHLLLCLLKDFFKLWFEIDGPWSLKNHRGKINTFLKKIQVPDFVTRIPRSTEHYSSWKANELRSFLLYFSLIILSECMTERYFQHWMLLVASLNLLLQNSVSPANIARSKIMLRMFCRDFPILYDAKYYTYYMHNLVHLHLVVERHGPLWCNSAFQFESFNGTLAKFVHGTKNQGKELINNVRLAFGVEALKARVQRSADLGTLVHPFELKNIVKHYKFSDAEKKLLSAHNTKNCSVQVYFRAVVSKSNTLTSSIYSRQKKRNNYTICFKDSAGEKAYGEVQCFCQFENKKVAIVRHFRVDHQRVFRHNATNVVITHIIPITLTDKVDFINLENINCKVIRVGDFVCLRPNKFEVNL